MPGYVYNGTLRGELDPWAQPKPAPKPKPQPAPPRQLKPCGTHAAHKRHIAHNEKPCQPCMEAKRAYDRNRNAQRRGTPEGRAAYQEYERARYLRRKKGEAA